MATNYKEIARRQARRYFSKPRDVRIFLRQMNQEAGFRDATSPAGAEGPAQIIPATAQSWGVKNVHDPREAYGAAAQHMADYLKAYHGSWAEALTAYNAGPGAVGGSLPGETQAYISNILGGRGDVRSGQVSPQGHKASFTPSSVDISRKSVFDSDAYRAARARSIVGSLIASHRGTDSVLFSTGLLTTQTPSPSDFVNSKLTSKLVNGTMPAGATGGGKGAGGGKRGKVLGRPIDRAGVKTKPYVIGAVRQIAGIYGHPITLGTGTAHDQMTVNGNVSDHWEGDAIDLPASGRQLVRMGRAALIAAGMSPAKARKIQGGLFNVNGWQIIFNTQEGGDHTDHLHVHPPGGRTK